MYEDFNKLDDKWIEHYYNKAISEKIKDLDRRDTFTNWGLTIFLGFITIYTEFLKDLSDFWKISILLFTTALLFRYFIHACLAYAWVYKWNKLISIIENYWVSDKRDPDINKVIKAINIYDHDRKVPIKRGKIVWGQLKTGYLLIFLGLFILLFHQLFIENTVINTDVRDITVLSLFYFGYEILIFLTYSAIDYVNNP